MGSIYRQKHKDKKTGEVKEYSIWWIKYYQRGKPYRESTHSDKKVFAERLLKQREGKIAEGRQPGINFDKVLFDDLAEDFLTDYRINSRDSLPKAERSVRYLKEVFGGMRVPGVTTDKIQSYIKKRMEEGLSNASINRELAALKRMFNLGKQCTPSRVDQVPYIPMLKESNVRKGFFEQGEYLALKQALPVHLQAILTFGYHSGCRKAEILGLTWDRVDLKEGAIRFDDTKNEESRTIYLEEEEEVLKELKDLFSKRPLHCAFVFHREGQPIKDFKEAWEKVCNSVGLKGKLFHDLRRTAVRNMVRSGIPERVAMQISGHKTRSVFDRYNIVSDQDLREAASKRRAYFEKQGAAVKEVKRGEVISFKSGT
jgi:integrase